MKCHWLTRVLSLVIALEMLCAPLSMVQAAHVTQVDEQAVLEPVSPEAGSPAPTQPEVVLPPDPDDAAEPSQPLAPEPTATPAPTTKEEENPPADDLAFNGFWYKAWSMGLQTESGEEGLLTFDRYFRPEIDTETTQDIETWLMGLYDGSYLDFVDDHTELNLAINPARVPDLKLEGFYAYTDEHISEAFIFYDETYVRSWVYAEGMDRLFGPEGAENLPLQESYHGVAAGDTGYTLPIVGRWLPSSIAQVTALTKLETTNESLEKETPKLYSKNLAGKPVTAGDEISFDPDVTEYYLRVSAATQTIDLNFQAYEPYYDYHKKLDGGASPVSPVSVSYAFAGKTTPAALTTGMIPMPTVAPPKATKPNNDKSTPARSIWALAAPIPLQKSAGTGELYNDIVLTVVSPDGAVEKTYTFHVQRMTDPTLTRVYGNMPYGMIARDTGGANWGTTPEAIAAAKQDALTHFASTNRFYRGDESTHYPKGIENQRGSIFDGSYTVDAWLNIGESVQTPNYDQDKTAIVAYQDSAFCDPGFVITDSEGNKASFGDLNDSRATVESVHRTLKLRSANGPLTPDQVKRNGGTEQYYLAGNLQQSKASEMVHKGDGSDQVDLRGETVLPGIYTMEYAYTDPITGLTYSTDSTNFTLDAKGNAGSYCRTVIVLPIPGDVDMDGGVTMADAIALEKGLSPYGSGPATKFYGTALATDAVATLFTRRVCDLTHDGICNEDDVAKLVEGLTPILDNKGSSDYYYIPLPTGEAAPHYARKPLGKEEPAAGAANLTLEYLGVEQGSYNDGITYGKVGPENADKTKGVTLKDTFWMGVKLEDAIASETLAGGVTNFTFSLAYNAKYVTTATVLTSAQKQALEQSGQVTPKALWQGCLRIYNMSPTSFAIWGGNNQSAYQFTSATQSALPYTTHYSKAITPLEAAVERPEELKQLVFSIKLEKSEGIRALSDGYLLAVPFTLIEHPYAQKSAQLVEMSAGMREFVFLHEDTARAGGFFASLFATEGEEQVAAYSAQPDIFGGSTENLKSAVRYTGGAGTSTAVGPGIPLGEDKSPITRLYNKSTGKDAVYSQPFENDSYQGTAIGNVEDIRKQLPPGLTINANGLITGTPSAARGEPYGFVINGTKYSILVQQASLRYYADNQSSYYGEEDFRGKTSDKITFKYYKRDIQSVDLQRNNIADKDTLNSAGTYLPDLLDDASYLAPTFGVRTKGEAELTSETKCALAEGAHIIYVTPPTSQNYKFEFVTKSEPTATMPDGTPVCAFSVAKRPIQVTQLANGTKVGNVYSDEAGILYGKKADTLGSGFMVEPSSRTEDQQFPLTKGRGLIGDDRLVVTYQADYVRHDDEKDKEFQLSPENVEESRFIKISNLVLEKEEDWVDYRLVSLQPVKQGTETNVTGTVRRRNITALGLTQLPKLTGFTYGASLDRAFELQFTVTKGRGNNAHTDSYVYTQEKCDELGVVAAWVTKEDKLAGEAGMERNGNAEGHAGLDGEGKAQTPYALNQLLTPYLHDGKYLCLSAAAKNEAGEAVRVAVYSENPIEVAKREMTLTAVKQARYYGEANAPLTFTYLPAQLANQDRLAAAKLLGKAPTGAGAELAILLNNPAVGYNEHYTQPSLAAKLDLSEKSAAVDENTEWSGVNNVITISGALADNYRFRYTEGALEAPALKGGYSTLRIEKRYVVVTAFADELKANLQTIYADTRRTYTDGKTLSLAENGFQIALPAIHTEKSTDFLPLGGSVSGMQRNALGYAPGKGPILERDAGTIGISYRAQFIPDRESAQPFPNGYFDMTTAVEGARPCDVAVEQLVLTGARAKNYELVYDNQNSAAMGAPADCTPKTGGDGEQYYAAATGTVTMRPVTGLELLTLPKLTYAYGDTFNPMQSQGGTGLPLQAKVKYDEQYENFPSGNTKAEVVNFSIATRVWDDVNNVWIYISSFDQRGLVLYSVPQGVAPEDVTEDMVLKNGDYMTPAKHNGTKLLLVGGAIRTALSTQTLTVTKRALRLTAGDQFRYYGEENYLNVTFTFDDKELAAVDREALKKAGMNGYYGDAALKVIQPDYTPPTMITQATKTSDVLDEGYGGYPVTIQGGAMENYAIESKGEGTLHVFRRPIVVDQIISSKDRPIYTIYADTGARVFSTQVSTEVENFTPYLTQARANGTDVTYGNAQDPAYNLYNINDKLADLPLTGDALLPEEELTYTVKVTFKQNLTGPDGMKAVAKPVILSPLNKGKNYFLTANTRPGDAGWEVTGYVDDREMRSIRVVGLPQDVEYTYPEDLNLTGLKVEVTYNKIDAETSTRVETFTYRGKESFNANGLYVNYYASNSLPGNLNQSAREAIRNSRIADNMDHVTIAPTHDTQQPGDTPFSANGKYLVVSGRLRAADEWVEPKIVKDERPAAAITVAPLQLKYTLAAENKTYDGDPKAVGTIALTNAFHTKASLDGYNPGEIHDVVYPVIGADYESKGTDHLSYTKFKELTKEKYSFKTGDYTPENHAVFNDNGTLSYLGGGYDSPAGKLKFRFTAEDVAYADPTHHDSYGALNTITVEATGLKIGGPDAQNYKIEPEITTETLGKKTPGYQGKALPEATILKRNRDPIPTDLLPKVQVDRHTNVVRMDYTRTPDTVDDQQDAQNQKENESIHFEYALGYLQGAENARTLGRWAGNDGTLLYQDTTFFGGEAIDPKVPPLYVPDEDKIPTEVKEEDIIRGQIYRWVAEDRGDTLSGMEGFLVNPDAYPGHGVYPGYELYKTARTALPREGDEVYFPLVRVAETHNYNPSPVLSPLTALTPEAIDRDEKAAKALKDAQLALAADPENPLLIAAVAAARTAKNTAEAAVVQGIAIPEEKAQNAAQAEVEQTLEVAESGKWPEEFADAEPTEAVQIYRQRLEVTSTTEEKSKDSDAKEPFVVPTLEAVYFTNLLDYEENRGMDAVLHNQDPTRYYNYYWDVDKSAELNFGDKDHPFTLREAFEVEIDQRAPDGTIEKKMLTVNEHNTAHLFVETTPPTSGGERAIHIVPHAVEGMLGDPAIQLVVEFVPANIRRKQVTWVSANPRVAVVDENSLLLFTGVGTTTITATSRNHKTDTITVTVRPRERVKYPTSILDLDFTNAYAALDGALRFFPEQSVTRGELVQFLVQFYKENPRWAHGGSGEFSDLTGEEAYAEAARLLGSLGVVSGTAKDSFSGEALATRSEMVALLARMLDIPEDKIAPMTGGFRDTGRADTWAYGYINAMQKYGILNGVGGGSFAPGRPITRAEVVAMMARVMNIQLDPTKKNLIRPSDVAQTHWGYYEILRSVNPVETLEPKKPEVQKPLVTP